VDEADLRVPTLKKATSTVGQARALQDELLAGRRHRRLAVRPRYRFYTFSPELTASFGGGTQGDAARLMERICHPDDLEFERPLANGSWLRAGRESWSCGWAGATAPAGRHMRILLRSGRRLPSGRFEMYGLTQDVTSSALARNEARAKAAQLNIALSAARGGVYEIDFQARQFHCSPEFVAWSAARSPSMNPSTGSGPSSIRTTPKPCGGCAALGRRRPDVGRRTHPGKAR